MAGKMSKTIVEVNSLVKQYKKFFEMENCELEITEEALREVEATQRRYMEQAWSEYLQSSEVTAYETEIPDYAGYVAQRIQDRRPA